MRRDKVVKDTVRFTKKSTESAGQEDHGTTSLGVACFHPRDQLRQLPAICNLNFLHGVPILHASLRHSLYRLHSCGGRSAQRNSMECLGSAQMRPVPARIMHHAQQCHYEHHGWEVTRTGNDPAEHDVLAVKMRCWRQCDEKL